MPKLAIYVPKKDMREIERWRKKINFSQVFMKALLREIRSRSRKVDAGRGKLAAAAEYYRQKLAEDSDSLSDFGYKLGTQHVIECRLDPETIRTLLEIDGLDRAEGDGLAAVEQAIGSDRKQVDELADRSGFDEQSHPAWRSAVYEGYVAGVGAAWKRICDEMGRK